MSQIPPDGRQPQPLNYERVQPGSGSSPVLRIVIFVLAAVVLLAMINWFLFSSIKVKMQTGVPSLPPVQAITTQPHR